MTPLDYIKKGWCQNHLALDASGKEVDVNDAAAIKWCAVGAIWAVYRDKLSEGNQVFRTLEKIIGEDIIAWNNKKGRT